MQKLIKELENTLNVVGEDQRDAMVRIRDLIDSRLAEFTEAEVATDEVEGA